MTRLYPFPVGMLCAAAGMALLLHGFFVLLRTRAECARGGRCLGGAFLALALREWISAYGPASGGDVLCQMGDAVLAGAAGLLLVAAARLAGGGGVPFRALFPLAAYLACLLAAPAVLTPDSAAGLPVISVPVVLFMVKATVFVPAAAYFCFPRPNGGDAPGADPAPRRIPFVLFALMLAVAPDPSAPGLLGPDSLLGGAGLLAHAVRAAAAFALAASARLVRRAPGTEQAPLGGVIPGLGMVGVAVSENLVVTDVNARFREMRCADGARAPMAVSEAFCLDRPGKGEVLMAVLDALQTGGRATFESDFPGRDGKTRGVLVLVRSLPGLPGRVHIWECVDISERKLAEKREREERDFLQAVVDSIPLPVLVKDFSGVFRLGNRACAALHGITPAEMVGKRDRDILSREDAFASRQRDAACRNLALGGVFTGEASFVAGGLARRCQVFKTARRVGSDGSGFIVTVFCDMTERARAEAALNSERYFLLQLVNLLPPMMCFLDAAGVVRRCDSSFRGYVQKPLDRIIGRPYAEINPFPEGDDAGVDRRMLATGEGVADVAVEAPRAPGGTQRRTFMLRRNVMYAPDGRILGLVKAFWDTSRLVEANRAAEAANRAKAAFLANMSHELRTPLNGIVGMADMILNHEAATAEMRFPAETIVNSAKALQAVLDGVMDFATREEADVAVVATPFDLRRLVEESVRIESLASEALGVSMDLFITSSLAPGASGDARRLRQILIQALARCCECADGGVRISVRGSGRVKGGRDVGFDLAFSPRAGCGADGLGRMLGCLPGQTGVGDPAALTVARLAEKLGGSLEIVEEEDGLRCMLLLPLPEDNSAKIAKDIPDLSGLRVAVASRNRFMTDSVRDYFAGAGAACETADSLGDLFDLMRHAHEANAAPIHILLVDASFLPSDRIGPVIADIKASGDFGRPRVVVAVSARSLALRLYHVEQSVDAYVSIPLLPSELWEKMEKIWGDILLKQPKSSDTEAMRRRRSEIAARRQDSASGLRIKARVLLVEDNPVNQAVAKGMLARIGCSSVVAHNGLEAVERIRAGERFDLVLMDCMMPVMNGYDATRAIRRHESENPDTKRHTIVALTANALPGDREKCLAAGMDGYMTKPVTRDIMWQNLMRYCRTARAVGADDDAARRG